MFARWGCGLLFQQQPISSSPLIDPVSDNEAETEGDTRCRPLASTCTFIYHHHTHMCVKKKKTEKVSIEQRGEESPWSQLTTDQQTPE